MHHFRNQLFLPPAALFYFWLFALGFLIGFRNNISFRGSFIPLIPCFHHLRVSLIYPREAHSRVLLVRERAERQVAVSG